MAYLGNDLQVAFPSYRNIDDISGSFDGVATSFPLTVDGVAPIPAPVNSQQCLISVNGVVQKPDDSGTEGFRLSGGNIIFAIAPTGGVDFFGVILAGADYVNVGANFPSGTAVAPSITFESDLDTGIYNPAGNQIGFTTAGTQRLVINSSGQISSGLGSAASPAFSFISDPNTGIYAPGADQLALTTNGTGRLFIDSSGRVGIGTSSPSTRLTVVSTGTVGGVNNATFRSSDDINNSFLIGHSSGVANLVCDQAIGFGNNNGGVYSERARIDSSGRLLVGTSSISGSTTSSFSKFQIQGNTFSSSGPGILAIRNGTAGSSIVNGTEVGQIVFSGSDNTDFARIDCIADGATGVNDYPSRLVFYTTADGASSPTERMRIDSSGRVGIGVTPVDKFQVGVASDTTALIYSSGANVVNIAALNNAGNASKQLTLDGKPLVFGVESVERARIDNSGRLLVGTSSSGTTANGYTPSIQVAGSSALAAIATARYEAGPGGPQLQLIKSRNSTIGSQGVVQNEDELGVISFEASDGSVFRQGARIDAVVDGTPGAADMPSRLVFSTTADGASSPTPRMTIKNNGDTLFTKTATDFATVGIELKANGSGVFTADGIEVLSINRKTSDGELVRFFQDQNLEGNISVSGTTVSYNGAHLSRWSQLPSGAERTEILRGTVLSNINEMCEWGEEDNEQLNRMKVSDVEGDKNVSGVFQGWDDDDDTYTNDFYCAMTGDFIIRIGAGVTVERGDLLMSAGDGTAKPQADDLVRSSTVAKVTSTKVSCTYDDGSYCVPCVLMAC